MTISTATSITLVTPAAPIYYLQDLFAFTGAEVLVQCLQDREDSTAMTALFDVIQWLNAAKAEADSYGRKLSQETNGRLVERMLAGFDALRDLEGME